MKNAALRFKLNFIDRYGEIEGGRIANREIIVFKRGYESSYSRPGIDGGDVILGRVGI